MARLNAFLVTLHGVELPIYVPLEARCTSRLAAYDFACNQAGFGPNSRPLAESVRVVTPEVPW